jgi:hypothetical protein
VVPAVQVRQSVLEQTPLAQFIIATAEQVPLPLQVEASVLTPWAHDCAGGQAVPAGWFPPSTQTGNPVAQDVVPVFLHGLLGVQAEPFMQVPHVPPRQNMVDPVAGPQLVPSAAAVPVSVQTGAPELQTMVPTWHLLVGVHAIPAVHATHALALLHTMFVPHEAPAALLAPSTHIDEPVAQDVVPTLQGVGLLVQPVRPGVQVAQVPDLQKRFAVPQVEPSARDVPRSVHTAVPVAHERVPL